MRGHPIATAQGVLHGPPGVILGCRLDVPDVTSVPIELARLEGLCDVLRLADGATSCVYEPCALLEVLEKVLVDQTTRPLM